MSRYWCTRCNMPISDTNVRPDNTHAVVFYTDVLRTVTGEPLLTEFYHPVIEIPDTSPEGHEGEEQGAGRDACNNSSFYPPDFRFRE